jgi:hypothetical protein
VTEQKVEQKTSFHYLKAHRGNSRIYVENTSLRKSGFVRGVKFTYQLDDAGETLILRVSNNLTGTEKLHTVSGKTNIPVIDIGNKFVTAWMKAHQGFWVHYRMMEIVLTRVEQKNIGQCVKQNVVATLLSESGGTYVGTNHCYNPQKTCPRDVLGMKSGEGYELCIDVCNQSGHAEVNAIRKAGDESKGAIIFLQGHDYACGNCTSVAATAGIKEIVVLH